MGRLRYILRQPRDIWNSHVYFSSMEPMYQPGPKTGGLRWIWRRTKSTWKLSISFVSTVGMQRLRTRAGQMRQRRPKADRPHYMSQRPRDMSKSHADISKAGQK